MLAAIKAEMAVFASSGKRGQFLQRAYDYTMTVPATSVEAEQAFSAAGIICSTLRCRLVDSTVDTLSLWRAYYRDTILPVASTVTLAYNTSYTTAYLQCQCASVAMDHG
jgi:hypothetical protein